MVHYSDQPRIEFSLNTHRDRSSVLKALRQVRYGGGNTKTGKYLQITHKQPQKQPLTCQVISETPVVFMLCYFVMCRSRDQLCSQGVVPGVSGDEAERSSRAGPADRWKSPG